MESYSIRSLLGITSHVEFARKFRFEQTVGAHASHRTPFLPTEVVLGSSRLLKIPSHVSSNLSSVMETVEAVDLRCEFKAPSWITFPSMVSSQRQKSSVSEADVDARITDGRHAGGVSAGGDDLRFAYNQKEA
ncbi:Serine/threonine-protein kinase-like protein cr4 [Asimina triloba]